MPYIYMHKFVPLPCFEKVKEKVVTKREKEEEENEGRRHPSPKKMSGLACLSGLSGPSGLSGLSGPSGLSGLSGLSGKTPQPENIDDEELQDMINQADRDGDGEINIDEFYRIMKKKGNFLEDLSP